MIVVLAAQAEADLEQIADDIARDDPRRAVSFVAELIERCELPAQTPESFALVPGWERRGVRRRTYGDDLIFYRASADRVEVLHVLNGARDYETILSSLNP